MPKRADPAPARHAAQTPPGAGRRRLVRDLRIGRERLWQFDPSGGEEARRSLEGIGRQWQQSLANREASA